MSGLLLPSDYAGGMIKVCSWDAFAPDGWPHVHALHTDGRGAHLKFAAWTKKFASRETGELVARFVKEAQPRAGHSYFLGTALGAYEAWGCNNNGDAFYEEDLVKESEDVGYRSFQKHAHVFEHHKNKDPNVALGKIVLATYNRKMRRVELIEEVDNVKAAHLLDQWHRNGSLPTSMGCATDPSTPIWTLHDGWKPIAEIKAGDKVWSGEGNPQRVSHSMTRMYDGDAYEVHFVGRRRPIEMTEEHPFRVVRREKVWTQKKSNGRPKRDMAVPESAAEYVRADQLSVGDYLVQPIPAVERDDFAGCDRRWARLAGYYLAEGYGNLSNGGKQIYPWFIVNKDDEGAWEIPHLAEQIEPGVTVTVTQHAGSDKALNIQIFSDRMGRHLAGWCGRTSADKRVASWLLEAPKWWQLEFLGTYLNGDGCFSGEKVFASTKSEGLAHDILMLFARLGMLGGVQEIHHQPSGIVSKPTTEYQVRVGAAARFSALASSCAKVAVVETMKESSNSPKILTPWAILTPITAIRTRRYVGPVYNFAVDGDDSYVACGVAVHNCKVAFDVCSSCGNKAKTPKEYCEHAKYAMKKIARDGHRFHVRNPDPRFFDQSHVVIPAEKTAGVMEKVAVYFPGVKVAEDDSVLSSIVGEAVYQAEMEKAASEVVDTATQAAVDVGMAPAKALAHETNVAATKDEVLTDEDQRVLKMAADSDPELPYEVLHKMAHYGLEMSIASMHAVGIVPTPREFQYLALHASGEKNAALAEQLYRDEITFEASPMAGDQQIDAYEKVAYTADWNVSPTIVGLLTPFIPGRSYIPEFLEPRLEKAAEQVKAGSAVVPAEQIRPGDPGIARVMIALGLSYGIVRAIMGEDKQLASGLMKVTKTHPAVAAALLTAGVAAGLKVLNSAVTPGHVAPRPGVGYEKVSAFIDDLEKTAAAKDYVDWLRKTPSSVKRVVVPFSVGYLSSAYLRGKQMRGQETNSVQNVVADHPLASGVAAVAGTALARKGLQKVVAAAKP